MTEPISRRHTTTALVAAALLLAAVDVNRSAWVPDSLHLALNVAVAVTMAIVARRARMTRDELGLGPGTWRSGLRWGGAAVALVTTVLVVAALVSPDTFRDDRTTVDLASMLWKTLVVIPLGTVLLEELAFRGVLLGLADRLMSLARATLLTAVLFGFWHVPGVIAGADDADSVATVVSAAAGTVVATTVAGLVFIWLRRRSDSLLAPMLAHVATNSVAFAVAWSVN